MIAASRTPRRSRPAWCATRADLAGVRWGWGQLAVVCRVRVRVVESPPSPDRDGPARSGAVLGAVFGALRPTVDGASAWAGAVRGVVRVLAGLAKVAVGRACFPVAGPDGVRFGVVGAAESPDATDLLAAAFGRVDPAGGVPGIAEAGAAAADRAVVRGSRAGAVFLLCRGAVGAAAAAWADA